MFNYIKFGMFLNSYLESSGGVAQEPEMKFQTETQDPKEVVNVLRNKFEAIKAGQKYVGGREEKLRTSLLKDGDPQDREYRELAGEVKRLQGELAQLGKTRSELSVLLGDINTEIKKLSPKETETLKTLSNKELLSLPFDKRLQYLTKAHTDTAEVSSGQVKELEITFTFDGQYNRELYFKTTAGQLLPQEVAQVTVGGEVYSRNGLSGEFFTPSDKRLIIEEGTKIEVGNLRTPEQIEKIKLENTNKLQSFLNENPSANKQILSEAFARGIDPKFAILAFSGRLEGLPETEASQILEDAFTEFDRYRGSYGISIEMVDGKYNANLAIALFMKFSQNWEELARYYGINEEKIKEAKSNGEMYMAMDADLIENADNLPEGGYLKGEKLLQNEAFSKRLDQVCENIGARREDLIKIMKAESGLDSRAVNSQSRATGLIQFIPSTAVDLGTTVGKLRSMTAIEQLDYVEMYFKKNSGGVSLTSIEKIYKAVFYPLALNKGEDFVYGSQNGTARMIADQNGVISKFSRRSDGLIDQDCFARYVNNHVSKFSA